MEARPISYFLFGASLPGLSLVLSLAGFPLFLIYYAYNPILNDVRVPNKYRYQNHPILDSLRGQNSLPQLNPRPVTPPHIAWRLHSEIRGSGIDIELGPGD